MNIALVLSGGIGSRVAADIPKQYIKAAGKPVIFYCLETLEKCKEVDAIQIVAEEKWQGLIREACPSKLKGFSVPGENRQLSILNGLEDIRAYAAEEDVVLVHDAARPLASETLIKELLTATQNHDGAMPVLEMKDTVYFSEDGRTVASLLDRNRIYAGQAPESFVFGKYYQANRRLSRGELLRINGSTEPAVLAGMDVVMVKGEELNFKITTKEDMGRFQKVVERK